MDDEEKRLTGRVNRAAAALRRALTQHKSTAEINRLGEILAEKQRALARYQSKNPPR